MGNIITKADINQILNNPGVFNFRGYGETADYIKAVFTNGASFSYAPEVFTQTFDDTGDVYDAIANESGEISFSFGKPFDLDFMSKLSGGLFTKTVSAAEDKVIAVPQVIAGGWVDKASHVLKIADSTGAFFVADGAPAILSVVAETVGALAENDDYVVMPDVNSYSGYSILFNLAGTAELGTDEAITITYAVAGVDVVGQTKLGIGGKKNYDAIEGYYESALKDGTPAYVYFYKGYYNGNINLSFGTEASPEAAVTDVTISLKLDTTRAAGDQLVSLVVGK